MFRSNLHNPYASRPAPADAPALMQGDGHVWLAQIDFAPERVAAFWKVLSPEEQRKASCYRLPGVRDRYICARGQLRMLLGWYLGIGAAKIQFRYNQYGKPYLSGDCAGRLHFNVAHSRGLALYALRSDGEVGVDIEYMNEDVAFSGIAHQFFSPEEYATLCALPAELRLRAFYDGWVRKEAYVKAVGRGLHISLSDFSVSLSPGLPARILGIKHDAAARERWCLSELAVPVRYTAAVAAEGEYLRLSCWRYPEGGIECSGNVRGQVSRLPALSFDTWPARRAPAA
jgi:4'-phosphopantetheinyl transferase